MATQGAATNYLERRVLSYIFKNNDLVFPPPLIYVGLAVAINVPEAGTVTEVGSAQDNLYARRPVLAANWTFLADENDANVQKIANNVNIEFPASAVGSDYTVTHTLIYDAATAGNLLFIGALDPARRILATDIFRINANNLTITLD